MVFFVRIYEKEQYHRLASENELDREEKISDKGRLIYGDMMSIL